MVGRQARRQTRRIINKDCDTNKEIRKKYKVSCEMVQKTELRAIDREEGDGRGSDRERETEVGRGE